jgi:hypothetical protein
MAQKKRQAWSYIAGKKGVNRVRAFEETKGGPLFLEWMQPEVDRATGERKTKRQRLSLAAAGITTYSGAIKKAEQVAGGIGRLAAPQGRTPLTLERLLNLYLREVTPRKKSNTQLHDRQAARMFLTYFGAAALVEFIEADGRTTTELGRTRYDAFIKARRDGRIPGFPRRVRNRIIEYDLKFLRAVFNWGTVEREDGTVLLTRNPWKGFPLPVETNRARPEMTEELHSRLVAGAPDWRMGAVMKLCRETRHRRNSVRQLSGPTWTLPRARCAGEASTTRRGGIRSPRCLTGP